MTHLIIRGPLESVRSKTGRIRGVRERLWDGRPCHRPEHAVVPSLDECDGMKLILEVPGSLDFYPHIVVGESRPAGTPPLLKEHGLPRAHQRLVEEPSFVSAEFS